MHSARYQQLSSELDRIVSLLRTNYDPDKIIAFGSFVNQTVGEWSDLDIAIVKETNKSFVDRLVEVARIIGPGAAADFLVYSPKEFLEMSETNAFVKDEIIQKGKLLYDKNKPS